MARTAQEVLDDLLVDKASRAELAVLTNPSNVAVWYNVLGDVSVAISTMEGLADELLIDVNSRAEEIPVGTLLWYAYQTLQYQHGDSLTVINGIPEYAVIDDLKKVVEVSAAEEQSGTIIIKAAKLDVSDNPIKLSAAELSGLQQYWIERRFAGSAISVISDDGDDMKAYLRIEVDGQKIAVDGQSQSAPGTYPVEVGIKEFYRLLQFNGRFTVTDLIDAIQAVDGVDGSVVATAIEAKKSTATTYVDVLSTDAKEYYPYSGYIVEDTSFLLRNTLTYVLI